MNIKYIFRAIVLLSLFQSPVSMAAVPSFEVGVRALANGDFDTVLAHWIPLAKDGHVIAQNNLGLMYASGNGVAEDHEEAVSWLTLAANQGYPEAQYELGGMYARGEGVSLDAQVALDLMSLAAQQGYPEAQAGLGLMYYIGNGVKADNERAYAWFNLAQINGDIIAQGLKEDVAQQMSNEEISKAKTLSEVCYNSAYTQC